MSEYAGRPHSSSAKNIEDLDNTGNLFEGYKHEAPSVEDEELERAVDIYGSYDEARRCLGIVADSIEPQQGVYVSLVDRYGDELRLMNIISNNSRGEGFIKSKDKPEIVERYEEHLPDVVAGVRGKMSTTEQRLRGVYHARALEDAGLDKYDIENDITQMHHAYREKYAGRDNEKERTARRRFLRKKLAEFGISLAS